jgi:hypothetical protein
MTQVKKGDMIMKTQSSNMLRLMVVVLLLSLIVGISGIVQANELKVPVSYGYNWYPAQRECGGSPRTYDFNHVLKAPKFNPNLGTLRSVNIRFITLARKPQPFKAGDEGCPERSEGRIAFA